MLHKQLTIYSYYNILELRQVNMDLHNGTKLVISSQWNNDFLELCKHHAVHEVYNSLRTDPFGSARPSACLPETTKENVEEHIKKCKEYGINFNYVINTPCLDNREYTLEGRKEYYSFLSWLVDIGVDYVTVAIPYLIELIKKYFPSLKVKVSEIANVNTAHRARYYSDIGVNAITLEIVNNRNFRSLQSIRKAVKEDVELEVVVNSGCLYSCPYHDYHNNIVAHTTQNAHELQGYYLDYCMMRCIPRKLIQPDEMIKACWIRPEDMHHYEEIGISRFKISNRVGPLSFGKKCLKAYSERKVSNLAEILTPLSLEIEEPNTSKLESFSNYEWKNMTKIWSISSPEVVINNNKLDGFIDYFKNGNCYGQCEADCNYCKTTAEETVKIDTSKVTDYTDMIDQISEPLLHFEHIEPAVENRKEQGISWTPSCMSTFDRLIAKIPEMFQDIARKAVSEQAEENAITRKSTHIEEQDLVDAMLSTTPDIFKDDMLESLREEGLYNS
jgi:collagenase-like PrtC family protease